MRRIGVAIAYSYAIAAAASSVMKTVCIVNEDGPNLQEQEQGINITRYVY